MSPELRLVPAADLVWAEVSARLDVPATKLLVRRLSAACADRPGRAVVVDFRGVDRDAPGHAWTPADLAALVADLLASGLGVVNKVAILRRPEPANDRSNFVSLLATDRGLSVGAFADFEAAFRWLFGEGDPV